MPHRQPRVSRRTVSACLAAMLALAGCANATSTGPSSAGPKATAAEPTATVAATPMAPVQSPTASNGPAATRTARPSRTPQPSATATPPSGTSNGTNHHVITTPWGRAWDAIPARFPLPAGASVAAPPDPAEGIASATFATAASVDAAVATVQAGLGVLHLSVEGIAEAEDGSVALSLSGSPAACRGLVRVRPLGSTTFVTVYYGAGCAAP